MWLSGCSEVGPDPDPELMERIQPSVSISPHGQFERLQEDPDYISHFTRAPAHKGQRRLHCFLLRWLKGQQTTSRTSAAAGSGAVKGHSCSEDGRKGRKKTVTCRKDSLNQPGIFRHLRRLNEWETRFSFLTSMRNAKLLLTTVNADITCHSSSRRYASAGLGLFSLGLLIGWFLRTPAHTEPPDPPSDRSDLLEELLHRISAEKINALHK